MQSTDLSCRCGTVRLTVRGRPILSDECLCDSCQKAGAILGALPGAEPVLTDLMATPFVMCRKDRVRVVAGQDRLKAHRLSDTATTRRFIAACCNTPVFLDFKGGHWLSLYAALWPAHMRPPVEMRTMVGARKDLPDDVPNLKTHSLAFYARLMGAWAAMGFRNPHVPDNGAFDAGER